MSIVSETHSWSEDNDNRRASGWNHSRLSPKGRALAAELGNRRQNDSIAAAFTSDLRRAVETAEIAFADTDVPILHDWRLRECNYGTGNGMPAVELHAIGRPISTGPLRAAGAGCKPSTGLAGSSETFGSPTTGAVSW